MANFCVDAMVRGYHKYQDIWTERGWSVLIRSGIALIYLLLLFTSAFTLSFTVWIIDGLGLWII